MNPVLNAQTSSGAKGGKLRTNSVQRGVAPISVFNPDSTEASQYGAGLAVRPLNQHASANSNNRAGLITSGGISNVGNYMVNKRPTTTGVGANPRQRLNDSDLSHVRADSAKRTNQSHMLIQAAMGK